ncbi:MAG: hypothetical protein PF904_11815 [Kiritimatiellae bacterium]|nr:hypothetical protein [Kiritimatiellia bacterium]
MLLEASRKYGVVTQMGNQGHAGAGLMLWQKMMDAGAFGDIKEVHSWSDRPYGRWSQGMTEYAKGETVPQGMSWKDWIGPAEMRPFSKAYAPSKWRGWWDFGCGAMSLKIKAGDNYKQWVDACKTNDPAMCKSNFEYSVPMTQAILLGCIA